MSGPDVAPTDEWALRLGRVGELLKVLASVAAAGAFFLVALTRAGMSWFYGHFGVTPADVGMDQTAILLGTAATGIVVFVAAAILGMTASALWRIRTSHELGSLSRRGAASLLMHRIDVRIAAGVAVVLAAVYLAWGVGTATDNLARIRSGLSTRPQIFAHGEIIAWCVTVDAEKPEVVRALSVSTTHRFVLLGGAQGVIALYDPNSGRTVRAPATDVVMTSC